MTEPISINSRHPLIGNWKAIDDFSDVIVSISVDADADGFEVSVQDPSDGEVAEVHDTKYDGDILSFNVHWPSNGRFIKYRFLLQSENQIDVTYTYSGQEIWQREET